MPRLWLSAADADNAFFGHNQKTKNKDSTPVGICRRYVVHPRHHLVPPGFGHPSWFECINDTFPAFPHCTTSCLRFGRRQGSKFPRSSNKFVVSGTREGRSLDLLNYTGIV